jgi:hypothetical protein
MGDMPIFRWMIGMDSNCQPWHKMRHRFKSGMKVTISHNKGRNSYDIPAEIVKINDNGQIRLHYTSSSDKEKHCIMPWWRIKLPG